MESLNEKVVIVTGSSSGIGAATAIMFSKLGCKVVITARNALKLASVSALCEERSPNKCKPLTIIGDIGEESTQEALIKKTVETFGKLDVLVNNAALVVIENIFSDGFPNAYDQMMNVLARAPMMLCRLALPHLISTKGCIINISSVASLRWGMDDVVGYHMAKSAMDSMTRVLAHDFGPKGVRVVSGMDDVVGYHMAKSAMDSMTRVLAHDFGPKGVRVVSVIPGWVKTSILESLNVTDATFDELAKDKPLRRAAVPEEIANVVCFMASSDASFVTGSSVIVDGGMTTM